jgi:competence protein ComEC
MNGSEARLLRIPLAPAAGCMIAGILAGRFVPLPGGFWAVMGAAALAGAAMLALRGRKQAYLRGAAQAAALGAALCLSAVHGRLAWFRVEENHVVTFTGSSRTMATLRGRVVTAPQIVRPLAEDAFAYHRDPQTIFLLEAGGLGDGPRARVASGLVRVTVDEPMRGLEIGSEVELTGWIGRFRPPANPGQYDSAEAGRARGVLAWCSVPVADGVRPISSTRSWGQRTLDRLRASAAQHFAGGSDEESGLLAQALLVGQRSPALGRLNEIMVRAGIAHYLSISGSHLAIFLGFAYLLCRLAAISRRRAAGAVLVILIAYVLIAEPNAPLFRSAIMAGAVCVAAIARRRANSLNSLAGAAIILLAADPLDLFSAGFQLSFAIVLGLILLHRPIYRSLWGRWLARQGLVVYRGEGSLRRWIGGQLSRWLRAGVAMSLAAWIASSPLAAWHFGLFSPYGQVLTTLLAAPVTAVLIPGYFSLALAGIAPNLSDSFARLAELAAGGLARIVDAIQVLPGLCVEVRPVGAAWAALCYAAVALWLVRKRLPMGRAAAIAASAILAGWTVYSQLPAACPKGLELNLLAVGDGQCAAVRTPGGIWLFDAGTRSTLAVRQAVLEPFLRDRCFRRPTAAFVSHANTDHYSAVADMAEAGLLRKVYLNEYFGRPVAGVTNAMECQIDGGPARSGVSRDELRFLQIMERNGVQVERLRAGQVVELDGTARVEVLWPPAIPPDEATSNPATRPAMTVNDTSLVLRLVGPGGSILLPGDAGEAPQAALLAAGAERLRADVLVMPHHGAWSPAMPEFVRAVHPKAVLASRASEPKPPAGGKSASTAAAADFYSRLKGYGGYRSTAFDGWLRVRLAGGEAEIHTMRDERRQQR